MAAVAFRSRPIRMLPYVQITFILTLANLFPLQYLLLYSYYLTLYALLHYYSVSLDCSCMEGISSFSCLAAAAQELASQSNSIHSVLRFRTVNFMQIYEAFNWYSTVSSPVISPSLDQSHMVTKTRRFKRTRRTRIQRKVDGKGPYECQACDKRFEDRHLLHWLSDPGK